MNDKVEKLYAGISCIGEDTVQEAQEYRPRGKMRRIVGRWAALAACVAVVGLGIFGLVQAGMRRPPAGTDTGSTTNGGSITNSGGGSGSSGSHSGGSSTSGGGQSGSGGQTGGGTPSKEEPTHYPQKPWYYWNRENEWMHRQRFSVLPWNILGENPGLTSSRHVDLDFTDGWNRCVATDKTVVTNPTDRDQTVTMVLPFFASLWDNESCIPTVTVNGAAMETTLTVGPYQPTVEPPYHLLLDEEFRDLAFVELPSLPEGQAVIYALSIPEVDMAHRNYRVTFTYPLDPTKTAVLTTCKTDDSYDPATGLCTRTVTLNQLAKERVWFVVCGEDLAETSVAVFVDKSCTIPTDWNITFTRKETELATLLDRLLTELWENSLAERAKGDNRMLSPVLEDAILNHVSRETFIGLFLDNLMLRGPLAYTAETANTYCRLDANTSRDRMMYVTFDLTVPAGDSAEIVTSARLRQGGYGYWGSYLIGTNPEGNLPCSKLTASVSGITDLDTLLADDLGLDPRHGVMDVTLDPAKTRFWHVDVTETPRPVWDPGSAT